MEGLRESKHVCEQHYLSCKGRHLHCYGFCFLVQISIFSDNGPQQNNNLLYLMMYWIFIEYRSDGKDLDPTSFTFNTSN